jgi:hypothetical protein
VNVFFDVDATIMGSNDGSLRPGVRELFTWLRDGGYVVYIWSGVGLRWHDIDRHDLRSLVETCFQKPIFNHHARLTALAVTVQPEFVVDDHVEVVDAFGGITVEPFYYFDPGDREMERVYDAIRGWTGTAEPRAERADARSLISDDPIPGWTGTQEPLT